MRVATMSNGMATIERLTNSRRSGWRPQRLTYGGASSTRFPWANQNIEAAMALLIKLLKEETPSE